MSGYWNRDASRAGREPFTAYCEEHLPVERPQAWQALEADRERAFVATGAAYEPAWNLGEYLARTFGGREHLREYLHGEADQYGGRERVREFARGMVGLTTPHGYAWTGYPGPNVGAPCAVCGRDC